MKLITKDLYHFTQQITLSNLITYRFRIESEDGAKTKVYIVTKNYPEALEKLKNYCEMEQEYIWAYLQESRKYIGMVANLYYSDLKKRTRKYEQIKMKSVKYIHRLINQDREMEIQDQVYRQVLLEVAKRSGKNEMRASLN